MPFDIRKEQLDLVFKQLPLALAANVINSVLVAGALAPILSLAQVVVWSGLLIGLSAFRFAQLKRQPPPAAKAPPEKMVFRLCVGAALSGSIWGLGLVLLMPDALLYRLLIAFVLGGMAAGAVVTLSPVLSVMTAFLVPCILPLAVRLALEGSPVYLARSALAQLFALGLFIAGWQLNKSIASTLHLRAELADVLAGLERTVEERTRDLRAARAQADKANQTKTRFLAAASHDLGQPFQAMRLF